MSNIKDNNLLVVYPDLSSDWDYAENYPLRPIDVKPRSNKVVKWICRKCGHKWSAKICNRTITNGVCSKCRIKKANSTNSLLSLNPRLSAEWNYLKNSNLSPSGVTCNSHKKVWWVCLLCGNEWEESVNKRNATGNSCFLCRSLHMKNPIVSKEWNFEKNLNLSPKDVSANSHSKVWWKCLQCNHEWKDTVKHRNYGRGCPACSKIKLKNGAICDSLPEAYMYILYERKKLYFFHNLKYGRGFGNRRFDFYFPNENKYVEVTSFNKKSLGISWIKYLRNIVYKKRLVEKVLCAKFEFLVVSMSPKKIMEVKSQMMNH